MSQDIRPAPFNVGDHVRYIDGQQRALPADGEGASTVWAALK
jgi:hypothetical protein